MRRNPLYVLVDTSGSMRGKRIQAVNESLKILLDTLCQNPFALETFHLNIITFDTEVKEYLPLTPIYEVHFDEIQVLNSGATCTGLALEFLLYKLQTEFGKTTAEAKGDWKPILFLITDGSPSDRPAFEKACLSLKQYDFENIVACIMGDKVEISHLKQLTQKIVLIDNMSSDIIQVFFNWALFGLLRAISDCSVNEEVIFPLPPSEIKFLV